MVAILDQSQKGALVVFEFMKKARNNLNAARLCLDNGFLNASANRAYYAAFHAAVAILTHKGFRKNRIDHEWGTGPVQRQADTRKESVSR